MFTSFITLLTKRIRKLGLGEKIEAAIVCDVAKETIKDFFRKKNNLDDIYFSPYYKFKNNILEVKIVSPIYLNELRLNEEIIKNKINKKLKRKAVQKIIF